MSNNQNLYQWFIITAIGGKEDSIVESLKEKIIKLTTSATMNLLKNLKSLKLML